MLAGTDIRSIVAGLNGLGNASIANFSTAFAIALSAETGQRSLLLVSIVLKTEVPVV